VCCDRISFTFIKHVLDLKLNILMGTNIFKSSMYTLNSIGEMTEPCGTPAGHGADDDNI
jgi:hypothetical protein